ncbi:hypothetical protein SAMN05444483_11186 [Salegentibacter echinorum]|uniref:DUF1853 domain-containing protein n=1 Tax=Salegentibacter echinorum TaxID=1073325 RepID=A0A1M5JME9_SALEC|nr:DUF1853 family protein [Salegentibacter echinorum]SHG41762.1 hypothetical protein SAMN05444483_11186 [Salegentibacter echinorum]
MHHRIKQQFQGFLATPPLWQDSFMGLQQFELPKNNISLENPEIEIPSLANNFVLGKRMESFFQFCVQKNEQFKLLAANIQISKEQITIGELDFLLKDLFTNKIFHIEMIYKFYVYDPGFSSEMQAWIGPNRKDSLLQKVDKLKEKQFPLLFRSETEELLQSLEVNSDEVIQKTYFKANLFIPKSLRQKVFSKINPACIAGTWVHFNEFNSATYSNFEFFSPKKQDWPIAPKFGETWVSHSEILEEIRLHFQKKKSPLIWIKKPGSEFERLFVVWW